MLHDDDVAGIVQGHDATIQEIAPELERFEAAYENKFWDRDNPWTSLVKDDDGLPMKLEANRVWPFCSALVSNLFYRRPTTEAKAPGVADMKRGRPKKLEGMPERVEALCDEWLRRADVQFLATHAYTVGLMYGAAAFKLGMLPKGARNTLLDRLWLDVIPRWECVWDDTARTPQQQLYRGHLRWEARDDVEAMLSVDLGAEKMYALPQKIHESPTLHTGKKHHLERYIRVLELYDLKAEKQRFYLVDPSGSNVKPIGEAEPMPYELPSGAPGVPMLPIVLNPHPRFPLRGIPAVRRIYQINAENNMTLTIVGNAMRRDAVRTTFYDSDRMDDDAIAALKSGRDRAYVPIKDGDGNLEGMWKSMEIPDFAATVPLYKSYLSEAHQDAQGFADVLAGRQLKYATAREVDAVAGSGEATVTDIGTRMGEALSRAVELALVVVASEMTEPVQVQRGKEVAKLTKETLELPWSIEITDAATTPLRQEKKRQEWGEALGLMRGMIERMTAKNPESGEFLASPEERKFLELGVDYTAELYGLPDSMTWEALELAEDDEDPEEKKARVRALLVQGGAAELAAGAEQPAPANGASLAPPPNVPVNPGVV